jgi:predicted dehydrogenase
MFKVGLVGWGAIGNVHGRAYKAMPDVQVSAVADAEPERREKAAQFMEAKAYSSAQELIERAEVDMVDICLPTYLHAEYAIKALMRGRHVLSEKPMALNLEECSAMIEAERSSGKTLMVAHCVRFWPEYHYLKTVYDSRAFGELQLLSLTRVGAKTMGSWQNWMLDPGLSGSQTMDRHIHDTDYVLYLLGTPAAVRALGHVDEAGLSHVSTHYLYPGGPAVFAEGGGNISPGYPFIMAYRAVFDKATVDYSSRNKPSLLVYPLDGKPYEPQYEVSFSGEASTEATGANISSLGAYWAEIRYLVDCIKSERKPTVVTPEQARETLRVVQAEVTSGVGGGKEVAL